MASIARPTFCVHLRLTIVKLWRTWVFSVFEIFKNLDQWSNFLKPQPPIFKVSKYSFCLITLIHHNMFTCTKIMQCCDESKNGSHIEVWWAGKDFVGPEQDQGQETWCIKSITPSYHIHIQRKCSNSHNRGNRFQHWCQFQRSVLFYLHPPVYDVWHNIPSTYLDTLVIADMHMHNAGNRFWPYRQTRPYTHQVIYPTVRF